MGIGEAIGGIVGGVGSLFGSMSASDAAEGAADQQNAIAQAQIELAKAQWDRYMKAFVPLEDKTIAMAQVPARKDPGYLANMADVNRNYGNMEANTRRAMGGRYMYGSGLEGETENALERSRVKDLGNLESQWDKEKFNRMYNVSQLGRGLPSSAMAGYGAAASNMGNLTNMYGALSQGAWGGLGTGLGNLYKAGSIGGWSNPFSGMFSGSSSGSSGGNIYNPYRTVGIGDTSVGNYDFSY